MAPTKAEYTSPITANLRAPLAFADVFLINTQDDIVYTTIKENDLATNLINGGQTHSDLGEAYRKTDTQPDVDPVVFPISPVTIPATTNPPALSPGPISPPQ